jgi:hypothetical protein
MATRTWIGSTQATFEVKTLTIGGTWVANDTITMTVGDTELVLTVGSTVTTTQIATELATAWNATTALGTGYAASVRGPNVPEMAKITATPSSSTVVFTYDEKGIPFSMSAAKVSTSGTVSLGATTNATGPNFWSDADNWLEGSVPTSSDDVYVDGPVSILYGIDQNAVTLTSLTFGDRWTGQVGMPDRNSEGYGEYRETHLKISATTLTIKGLSTRMRINVGSNQTAATVWNSGTTATTGLGAINIIGTHASNTLTQLGGDVSVAAKDGETSTIATITKAAGSLVTGGGVTLTNVTNTTGNITVSSSTTSFVSFDGTVTIKGGTHTLLVSDDGTVNVQAGTVTTLRNIVATVTTNPGVTLTTVDSGGGNVTLNSGCTTLTSDGGTMTVNAGNMTTANINGGTFNYGGTGTIGTLNWGNCTIDFNHGTTAACTVTTLSAPVGNCTFKDASDRVTVTNGFPTPVGTTTIKAA